MGLLSTCLSQSLLVIRKPNSRFIGFKSFTPCSTICFMETRSLLHSHGRNINFLDTGPLLWISPILSDTACTKQNTVRPSTHNDIDNSLLTNTIVVSTSVEKANKETNPNTKFNYTFTRSKRESPSISVEQSSYVSGMAGFPEGLSLQGVSEETTQLSMYFEKLRIGLEEVIWLVWLMESWFISVPCELCFRVFKLIILSWKAFIQNIDQPFLPIIFMLMTSLLVNTF